jgi:hypothetical protein
MTDKFDSDINFSKVLFLHINRTAQSIINPDLYIGNVEVLEILLSPYLDGDYEDNMAKTTIKTSAIAALDPLMKGKKDLVRSNTINKTSHKFRALMSAAEKKGLLLEKEAYGFDEGIDETKV